MKRIFILWIFLLVCLQAQDFAPVGAKWYYTGTAGYCPRNCEYLLMESVKDTIFQGKNVRKLTRTTIKYTGDTIPETPLYLFSRSDSVFLWSTSRSRFILLYVFNKNVGDTITLDVPDESFPSPQNTYRLVIDSIALLNVQGATLKKYFVTPLDSYTFFGEGVYIDRIGGGDWFFPRAVIIPEGPGGLRCYQDSQIFLKLQNISCDSLYVDATSFKEKPSPRIIAYPNPTKNLLFLAPTSAVKTIYLYDLSGKLQGIFQKTPLDLSSYPDGEYILKIHLQNDKQFIRKIRKKSD